MRARTWLANVITRLESALGTGKRNFKMLATRCPSLEVKLSSMRCG